MATLQAVKRRIRSVGSTRQITRAMQLVAASKLRQAQAAALGPQPYEAAARKLLARLSGTSAVTGHPLYTERKVQRALTIVVAGDRGLAGAFNSNVLRELNRHIATMSVPQQAICIGKYAALHVARTPRITEIAAYGLEQPDIMLDIVRPVLQESITAYLDGSCDRVDIIYTRFISTVRQEVVTEPILPVMAEVASESTVIELEPDADTLVDYATRRLLGAHILQAILSAAAAEQASRMLAMMNATDNAKDLIDDLTLSYNNARQGAVTQELAEITGGAEAING